MCASKKAKDASACSAENIFEESIFEAFRVAWNGVVANKDNLTEKWDDQIENGNPLERLRAKQMKMLMIKIITRFSDLDMQNLFIVVII